MTKRLEKFRNICAVIITIETVVIFLVTYLLKDGQMSLMAMYALIKNVVIAGCLYLLTNLLNNESVSVKDVLDEDASNAFVFGGVGLIKYDEGRNITWISDLFKALDIHIVGDKLLEWQPQLATLFEDEDIKTVDINSRKYRVYNNKDTRIMYFKDVTDLVTISKDYEDGRVCFAYIGVDNYEETIDNADEEKGALLQTTVRQMLFGWAKENNIIIKRYKRGGYVAVFDERTYRKQIDEHFSFLETFKNKMEDMHEFMTLSIGIGRGDGQLRELDEMAFSALNLSYSRGGDQVAVKTFNDKIRYFGGNSESLESGNRIRSRVVSRTLTSLIRQASNIIIMGHKNSDLDSFGASVGIYKICKAYNVPTNIIINLESCEEKTKSVIHDFMKLDHYRDVLVTPVKSAELKKSNTLLIMVDHHKKSLSLDEALVDMIPNKVVIDHHRRGEEFVKLPLLTYLEPSASSTVELVTELYDYQSSPIELTGKEATAMYAGILIDTNYFKTRVGARTFQVAAKLKDFNASVAKAHEILEDTYIELQRKMSVSVNNYIYKEQFMISYGDGEYQRPDLAKASNDLLSTTGIEASFAIGYTSKEVVSISARSKNKVNVQLIMEKLGGGGHFTMAACGIKNTNVLDVRNRLEKAIDEYLEEREDG